MELLLQLSHLSFTSIADILETEDVLYRDHVIKYIEFWYPDLNYLFVDGVKYYEITEQFTHALNDAKHFTAHQKK